MRVIPGWRFPFRPCYAPLRFWGPDASMTSARRMLVLPFLILALMLQGLGPSAMAVAQAADPFANLPTCSTDLGGGGQNQAPGAPAGQHQDACEHCLTCASPVLAVDPGGPCVGAPAGPVAQAAPVFTRTSPPRPAPRGPAQARAPPAFS
jgi:hypothetical protein